uniref:Uncharacterized protein n=1 Tax=Oryza meridionalis TaxID=40149 RepID=A0A0E0C9M3_9ORYZ
METMAYGIHRLRFMELNNRCEKQIERDGGEDRNPRWTGDAVVSPQSVDSIHIIGLDQQGLEVMRFLVNFLALYFCNVLLNIAKPVSLFLLLHIY